MKGKLITAIFFLSSSFLAIGQDTTFWGAWRGIIQFVGQDFEEADVIYLQIEENEEMEGFSRIELLHKEIFALKQFTGKLKSEKLELKEQYVKSSSYDRSAPKCKLNYTLRYDQEDGYLKGEFISSDCKNLMGEVILYRKEGEINMEKEPDATHYWKHKLVQNLDRGLPAPEVLKREQENFEFQPIYFDHDKSEVKPEFHDYLDRIIRILHGIHDVRIKVTGHTDAVGTDAYNIGLSERRARAIKEYFLSRGIPIDKLEIDFKGERKPVDTNETPEGKQRNRRVDFKFI